MIAMAGTEEQYYLCYGCGWSTRDFVVSGKAAFLKGSSGLAQPAKKPSEPAQIVLPV